MAAETAPEPEIPVTRHCPVCEHPLAIQLHRQRFELGVNSPLPSEYAVVSCTRCAFVYADTVSDQAAYDRYYELSSSYEDASVSTGGGGDELDNLRLRRTASIITSLAEKFRIAGKVLDIGCARGGLLQTLRSHGFSDLTGMDPSQACIDEINRSGLTGIKTKLSEIREPPENQRYKLVILSHVLEHVRDLRSSMQRVAGLLDKHGVVYVEVPDAARYRRQGFPPFYFFDCEHINHFDTGSLQNLAGLNGFTVLAHDAHEIDVAGGRKYPVIWAALSRTGIPPAVATTVLHLRSAVAEYIAQSTAACRYDALSGLAESRRPVVLWGAGSHAQRLLANSPLARCNIVGIVDRNSTKQGQSLVGITVSAPEMMLQRLGPEAIVVVASALHASEILDDIRASGVSNDVIVEV